MFFLSEFIVYPRVGIQDHYNMEGKNMYEMNGSGTVQSKKNRSNRFSGFLNRFMDKRVVIFMIILMFVLLFSILFITRTVTAKLPDTTTRLTVSVKIEKGDTLWKIASEYYSEEFNDMETYIGMIKRCNGLTSDTIHAGGYLVIPYYAEE